MANNSNNSMGYRRLLVVLGDRRVTIRLGRIPMKDSVALSGLED